MKTALIVVAGIALLGSAPVAQAATTVRTYSPIDEDGTLRDGLAVERGGALAECSSESYVAYQAVRCIAGSFIRDPCFIDTRREEAVVLCIGDPWSKVALSYDVDGDLPEPSGSDITPWGLELRSGARCVFVSGATLGIGSFRLNYFCVQKKGRRSPAGLYGSPNRSRPTWSIRAVRPIKSRKLYRVAIGSAWR